jgi:hypothetical protein
MSGHKSVTGLGELYTVVVGLALAIGVGSIVGSEGSAPQLAEVLAGIAVVVTLIPFYHGGLRHLRDTYTDDAVVTPSLILWDFLLLFVEACLLLAAAASLQSIQRVASFLVALWLIDVLWLVGSRVLGQHPPLEWAFSNVVAALILALLLLSAGMGDVGDLVGAALLLSISLARTGADYLLSRDFYFPPDELGRRSP